MQPADVAAQLNDPWAALVLRKGTFPGDLDKALAALDPPAVGFNRQESFFVSESGHLPINLMIARDFRMVVTRAKPVDVAPAIMFSAPAGERQGFIELLSWDSTKKAFNFYRRTTGTEWVWKGDTRDAFRAASRGEGCFACHVHGVPVMKELRLPWSNWHSQSAPIPGDAIPSDEIRNSPLFLNRSGAERLERVIRASVQDGLAAHLEHVMTGDEVANAPDLLRPLFETPTVNLVSSDDRSTRPVPPPSLSLPSRFFLNFDVFSGVLALATSQALDGEVKWHDYHAALTNLDVRLEDGARFDRKGDTHFAFLVPEPALEQVEYVRQLIARKAIDRHFALSVLAIDFPNPVYSADRTRLLSYVPRTAHIEDGRADLSERTALAIIQAAGGTPDKSPEREFAANWELAPGDLRADVENRVKNYLSAVEVQLKSEAGVKDYMRLAASRRHSFAESPLNEFPLLLPRSNVPTKPVLRMTRDGMVFP